MFIIVKAVLHNVLPTRPPRRTPRSPPILALRLDWRRPLAPQRRRLRVGTVPARVLANRPLECLEPRRIRVQSQDNAISRVALVEPLALREELVSSRRLLVAVGHDGAAAHSLGDDRIFVLQKQELTELIDASHVAEAIQYRSLDREV